MTKNEFLIKAKQAAMNIGVSWPGYWAAEAALESAFGSSRLCTEGNNIFGEKVSLHTPNPYGEIDLPTREYVSGTWIQTTARWVKYPDWDTCFRERLALLKRLAPSFPHYADALAAHSGPDFVCSVSASWSTDPRRCQSVLDIYDLHKDVLA